MKKNYITKSLMLCGAAAWLMMNSSTANAQAPSERLLLPGSTTQVEYLGANTSDPNQVTPASTTRLSAEKQTLISRVKELRNSNDPSTKNELKTAEAKLAQMNGMVEHPSTHVGTVTRYSGSNSLQSVTNTLVYPTVTTVGIATTTEQRGTNMGRVWIGFGIKGNAGTTGDTLLVAYSDDYGVTWTGYALAVWATTSVLNYDDMDMEMIESTTGDKYLYVVTGLKESGVGRIGYLVVDVTTFGGTFGELNWANGDPANNYYNPRITSDNAYYTGNAYAFITCSYDSSLVGAASTKIAECTNPYTTTPVFAYKDANIYWYSGTGSPAGGLISDVAPVRSGTADTLVTSFSANVFSYIFFSRFSEYDFVTLPTGYNFSGGTNHMKFNARLASHGIDDGGVLCVFNELDSIGVPDNSQVQYWRSAAYGWFDATHTVGISSISGSTTFWNYQPDVVGIRGGDSYFYSWDSNDSVHYWKTCTQGCITPINDQMNWPSNYPSGTQGAKPGFTYKAADSCFVAYAESGPFNVWAASGCNGEFTSVSSVAANSQFNLSQNYPNPASGTTVITYNLSDASNIMLTIRDVQGNLVKELVNEKQTAGSHSVQVSLKDFAAGVYSYTLQSDRARETKQMVVLK